MNIWWPKVEINRINKNKSSAGGGGGSNHRGGGAARPSQSQVPLKYAPEYLA